MAYEDANEFAFQGGDTEPETAKAIHERNQALQGLSDAARDAGKAAAEARQEQLDKHLEVEAKFAEDQPDLVQNVPVQTPPAEAQPKASKKS